MGGFQKGVLLASDNFLRHWWIGEKKPVLVFFIWPIVACEKRLTKTLRRTLIWTTVSTKSPNLHTVMQQLAITIKRHLQVIRHSVHAAKTATTTTTTTTTATTTIGKIKPVLVYFIWPIVACEKRLTKTLRRTLIWTTVSTKSPNLHTVMQQLAITIKRHLQAIRHSKHATITTAATTKRTDLCHTCRCI